MGHQGTGKIANGPHVFFAFLHGKYFVPIAVHGFGRGGGVGGARGGPRKGNLFRFWTGFPGFPRDVEGITTRTDHQLVVDGFGNFSGGFFAVGRFNGHGTVGLHVPGVFSGHVTGVDLNTTPDTHQQRVQTTIGLAFVFLRTSGSVASPRSGAFNVAITVGAIFVRSTVRLRAGGASTRKSVALVQLGGGRATFGAVGLVGKFLTTGVVGGVTTGARGVAKIAFEIFYFFASRFAMRFGVAFSWRGKFALPGNGVARPTLDTFGGLVKIVAHPAFHPNVGTARTNFATVKDHRGGGAPSTVVVFEARGAIAKSTASAGGLGGGHGQTCRE